MKSILDRYLSSKKSFTISKVNLKAFNPKTKKSYNLRIPSFNIEVRAIDSTTLLDKEDSPKSITQDIDWSWLGWLFSYIAVFIAGFLTPKDILKKRYSKRDTIEDKIKLSKTHKELLKVLLSQNREEYREAIDRLESVVYKNGNISLNEIKKELL